MHDHDKALGRYRDVLGLEVRMDVSFEGMRWVTLSPQAQPGVQIVLEPPDADPNASPADRQVLTELPAKGLLRGVIFATDDCDATFEHVRAAGTEVMREPIDQPYGVRDCAFRDPSGNLLRFSRSPPVAPVAPVAWRPTRRSRRSERQEGLGGLQGVGTDTGSLAGGTGEAEPSRSRAEAEPLPLPSSG